ncbi:MAG TPA: DegT/DnrJ/EryC1/StrS family aminotransferase [Gemmatimonadaceae bacterium]|nr:DegT/DnrJ/EryC1/StrS family aminotransferase [Gemmatimonadaceae bacterium]
MIPRHQLAVAPRITLPSLLEASASLCSSSTAPLDIFAANLQREFSAPRCVLTDSGTSALVLALRLLVGKNGTVALPGYGCVDITSAVRCAGIRARLYDVDPRTLSPDLDSVLGALTQGVDAILVAHYYGYPADITGIRALAAAWNVPVLEDAAQAAGGTLDGARLGSLGDVSVLSFGRGKGLFGGRGGALLVRSAELVERMPTALPLGRRRGFGDVAAAMAQWALGRPTLYAVPASLPWLHLGEMVYRPAHEPRGLSHAAATLANWSLANEQNDRRLRSRRAEVLDRIAAEAESVHAIRSIDGGTSGYLRFAVLDTSGSRNAAARLGVMRAYPRTLREQPELRSLLLPSQPAIAGADELTRSLFTLPTHFKVRQSDFVGLRRWLAGRPTPSATAYAGENLLNLEVAVPKSSSV